MQLSLAIRKFRKQLVETDFEGFTDSECHELATSFFAIEPSEYESLLKELSRNEVFFNRLLAASYLGNDPFHLDETLLTHLEVNHLNIIPAEIDDWLEQSFDELVEHQEKHGHNDVKVVETVALYSNLSLIGVDLKVVFHDQRPQIGRVLWDRIRLENIDPINVILHIACIGFLVNFEIKQQSTKWVPAPLFKYHPERYKQTRQYTKNVPFELKQAGFESGEISQDSLNTIVSVIVEEANRKGLNEPLREKIRSDPFRVDMSMPNNEIELYMLYSQFIQAGRQIFDLSGQLVEMFKHTGVEDIPVSLLVSPYETYYLYFGTCKGLCFDEGWLVDGVYIQHLPDFNLIQFMFTSAPDTPNVCRHWTLHREPIFTIAFTESHFAMNLGDAVRDALDSRRQELHDKVAKGNLDHTDEVVKLAREHGQDPEHIRVVENAASVGKGQLEQLEKGIPVMQSALDIAVNAMCYLTAYPDDITREWPSNAPRAMVSRTNWGKPSVQRNTVSKLEALGYRLVNFAGRALTKGPSESVTEVKQTVRTHWRRGHWKRQPHGPGRKLRKFVLIKPVLVNPGDGFQKEPLGGIYIGENVVDLKSKKSNKSKI